MKKRFFAILLAGAMLAAAISACDAGAAAPAEPAQEAAEAVEEAAEATEEVAEAAEEVAEAAEEVVEEPAAEEWEGDVDEINVLFFDLRGVGENAQPIIDAMNEITAKKAGVVIKNARWAAVAEYANAVSLGLSSGEQLDIVGVMPMAPASFSSMVAAGQLTDLTDIIDEEAPELRDLMGEYLSGMSVNGQILGVPCFRNYASAMYIIMRDDILESVGMLDKAKALDSWSGLEEIWAAVKASDFNGAEWGSARMQAGLLANADKFADSVPYDVLGDSYNLVFTDNDGHVSLSLENPDFVDGLTKQKAYWDADYCYKDGLTTEEHVDTLTKAGIIFSSIQTSEMGVEAAKKEATGYDETCIEVNKNMLTSSHVNKFGMAVPVTAQEPEAAVRWLAAVWTDPVLENLLIWGIEGEDYVITETGEADFPEGTDGNVKYHGADFVMGNYFNALPWVGNGVGGNFRQAAYDYLVSSDVSPYMGFTSDNSGLDNTITAINSVYNKWGKTISFGAWEEGDIEAYIAELKTAGVEDYLGAMQEQLDAWRAAVGE
ncbi:MAG: ABC transporter substrate-binding protein [Lachnospiraceae bacterium]|nr:ABC transporter substrate-binding protein [Lachnospiraceae bacterium]